MLFTSFWCPKRVSTSENIDTSVGNRNWNNLQNQLQWSELAPVTGLYFFGKTKNKHKSSPWPTSCIRLSIASGDHRQVNNYTIEIALQHSKMIDFDSILVLVFSRNSFMNTPLTAAAILSHASMVVIAMIHAHCGRFIACIIIKIDHHGTVKQINFSLFSLKMTNFLSPFCKCQRRVLQTHHPGTKKQSYTHGHFVPMWGLFQPPAGDFARGE